MATVSYRVEERGIETCASEESVPCLEQDKSRAKLTKPDEARAQDIQPVRPVRLAAEDPKVEERGDASHRTRRKTGGDGEAGEGDQAEVDEADCGSGESAESSVESRGGWLTGTDGPAISDLVEELVHHRRVDDTAERAAAATSDSAQARGVRLI